MPLRYSAAASKSGAVVLGVLPLGAEFIAMLAAGMAANRPMKAVRTAIARIKRPLSLGRAYTLFPIVPLTGSKGSSLDLTAVSH
jgi:hypothetical protein